MIQIKTQKQFDELLENYMTFEEAAKETGYSLRTIYRMSYNEETITVKLCLPGQRRRQLRLIPRKRRASEVLKEGLKLRNQLIALGLLELPDDDFDPFADVDEE